MTSEIRATPAKLVTADAAKTGWLMDTFRIEKPRVAVNEPLRSSKRLTAQMMATMAAIAIVLGVAGRFLAVQHNAAEQALTGAQGTQEMAQQAKAQLAEERRAKEAAERGLKEAQSSRETAERAARQAATQLAEERRAKEAAERGLKEAQAQLGKVQHGGTIARSPRQRARISELFTLEDVKRVDVLAEEKRLRLPPIQIREPAANVPQSMRRFIGIWVSDSGVDKTSRQSMLIVTNVLRTGHAVGFYVVGPSQPTNSLSKTYTRADLIGFVGRISGSEFPIKQANPNIIGELGFQNEVTVAEAWKMGFPQGRVVLKPVWMLTNAERTTKPQ